MSKKSSVGMMILIILNIYLASLAVVLTYQMSVHEETRFTTEIIPDRSLGADGYEIYWINTGFNSVDVRYCPGMGVILPYPIEENHIMHVTAKLPRTVTIKIVYYKYETTQSGESSGGGWVRINSEVRKLDYQPLRKH